MLINVCVCYMCVCTKWVLVIELWSSGLVVSDFTHLTKVCNYKQSFERSEPRMVHKVTIPAIKRLNVRGLSLRPAWDVARPLSGKEEAGTVVHVLNPSTEAEAGEFL